MYPPSSLCCLWPIIVSLATRLLPISSLYHLIFLVSSSSSCRLLRVTAFSSSHHLPRLGMLLSIATFSSIAASSHCFSLRTSFSHHLDIGILDIDILLNPRPLVIPAIAHPSGIIATSDSRALATSLSAPCLPNPHILLVQGSLRLVFEAWYGPSSNLEM